MKRPWLVLALALPGFGFTDCQYFAQVSINTSETNPPIVGARMWVDGVESIRPGDSVTYSSTGDIVVVPFVYDAGGASNLTVGWQNIEVFCHAYDLDPEESQVTNIHLVDKVASQPGGAAGEQRSNGLYTVSDPTALSSYAWYCHPGFTLETITYSWAVTGRDFAGNQSSASGSIIYDP